MEALKGELANFKIPKRVFFVADLPAQRHGKVQRTYAAVLLNLTPRTFHCVSRSGVAKDISILTNSPSILHGQSCISRFQSRYESEPSVLTLNPIQKGLALGGLWVCGEVAVRRAIHISIAPFACCFLSGQAAVFDRLKRL